MIVSLRLLSHHFIRELILKYENNVPYVNAYKHSKLNYLFKKK